MPADQDRVSKVSTQTDIASKNATMLERKVTVRKNGARSTDLIYRSFDAL